MNDTELLFVDSVRVITTGSERSEYYFAVGAKYCPRYGISLGKISKLSVQIGSDAVTVVAKVISDEKEILVVSNFFKNNIACYEATAPYYGELEPYEEDE